MVSGADELAGTCTTRDGMTAVAIAPDLGERYLDTIYQSNWVADLYGADVLCTDELEDASQFA